MTVSLKDSGVEWLGMIPERWQVVRGSAVLVEQRSKNDPLVSERYLSLMANIGVIPYEEKGDVGNKKPEDVRKCKLVSRGDFVINSMNYAIGSYGVSDYDGVCSPVYVVMKHQKDLADPRFIHLILSNPSYQSFAQSFGTGILDHRRAIGWDEIKVIGVPLPNLSEQAKIAEWTSRELARIDTLVTKKLRFIELLSEKRRALVTHAVTKGLNANAPMKDSGVEWLGEVPAHWKVMMLRRVVSSIEQGWSPDCDARPAVENEWGVMKSGCVNGGVFNERENKALPERFSPRPDLEIRDGDVLMSRASGSPSLIGSAAYVANPRSKLMMSDKIFRISTTKDSDSRFLVLSLGSSFLRRQIELAIGGAEGLANNLSQSSIKSLWLTLPPLEEQRMIVAQVDRATSRIDTLIAKTERSIELLREHRTALITAAVTGKIDLREAA